MSNVLGLVTFVSGKGWYFAENLSDNSAVFIHQNQIENQRYLRVDDRISMDVVPSATHPGKTQGINVKYLGHTVARQVGDKAAL